MTTQDSKTGSVTITTTTLLTPQTSPDPCHVTCPSCHQHVTSLTEFEKGSLAWLIAGGLCLVGCWLGCCLIPFCVKSAQDVIHKCPNCNAFLGRYRRLN
ncbi:hypothetical protein RvY_06770 [Ramazzottius varieornatus]|uniref:LITAF domain-containing protein n=1 Tax=Ramazzottius varieornatus TaxID=947166 RepID=A0A1D1V8D9_RAMVA|nr:hypothetical protein RvY_06770 [Ramazzottius varieornatus]